MIFFFVWWSIRGSIGVFQKVIQTLVREKKKLLKRELEEETGITDIKIISDVSFNQKYIFEKDGIVYDKSVKYFPGFVSVINTTTPDDFKNEISEMKWLVFKEARELITFDNAKILLDELEEYLNKLSFV